MLHKIKELHKSKSKALAILLDPDKVDLGVFEGFLANCVNHNVDFFFVGGSLISNNIIKDIVQLVRQSTKIPVVLFPGSVLHIEPTADAILLLSLISGRNPDLLIGQHVVSAPILRNSGLEILPTGYLLIDSGSPTTVSYMSNTTPIPANKPDIAACTAMAGEMLGLQYIYLDAGSGATNPVSAEMIRAVREVVDLPIIIGGGINSPDKARAALAAGADIIVIGNAFEQNPELLFSISAEIQRANNQFL